MTQPDTLAKLAACPFCGDEPKTTERPDNIDGTEFFYAVMCYCGGYSATAHKMAIRKTPEQAKADAVEAWNRRALTAQALPAAEPTRPANSQDWAGMDGQTAYWLIERHADGWADIALMMSEWLAANQAAQQAAQAPAGWASAASKAIEVLTTTAGNIRSLGPAGALEPWANYLVWLDVVEKAAADLANALPQPQEDAA